MFPQTRPSSNQSVKKLFRLNILQPHKNIQNYGWAALPNIPCHGPARFTRWKTFSSWSHADCQQRSNQRLVVLLQTRSSSFHCVENNLLVGTVWSFLKTFKVVVGSCSPKHSPFSLTVWKNFFVSMLCTRLKPFKFMTGPRSPTSPVTAQLISQR